MAAARWRLLRVWDVQKNTFDRDMALQDSSAGPPSVRAAFAFRGSPESACPPEVLLRYEVAFDRQFTRALTRLMALQAQAPRNASPYRTDSPDGPIWADAPDGAPQAPAERTQEIIETKAPRPSEPGSTESGSHPRVSAFIRGETAFRTTHRPPAVAIRPRAPGLLKSVAGLLELGMVRRGFALFLLALCGTLAARQPEHARHAMVVAGDSLAADIGVKILQNGGNAVDAAVAIGFAMSVTYPYAGNLGGGGFMLVRLADGRSTFIDFRESAPGKASRDMYLDAQGNATRDSIEGWRHPLSARHRARF